MSSRRNQVLALVVFAVAALYYSLLSAKTFTWVFSSGDSGDWLSSALSWIPPQPFGNPVFVLLGHLLNALPGDLVIKMTVVGSCLPSAVTVALVFLITQKLTHSVKIGLLSAAVLAVSAVFLTQATVLMEYPLAVMPTTLACWFYIQDRKTLVALCLGIGAATQVAVGAIAIIWFAIEWRRENIGEWKMAIPVFLAAGILPYSLTLWELWRYNGGLSLHILTSYISNTAGVGELAITALPGRLLHFVAFTVGSLGIALIPAWYGLRMKKVKGYTLLALPAALVSWYYLTSLDPTLWHYLLWTMPSLAVFTGLGMKVLLRSRKAVVAPMLLSVLALFAVNTVWLNANHETEKNPVATNLYREFMSLTEGAVVSVPGGWKGFILRYAQVSGRPDLVDRKTIDGKVIK